MQTNRTFSVRSEMSTIVHRFRHQVTGLLSRSLESTDDLNPMVRNFSRRSTNGRNILATRMARFLASYLRTSRCEKISSLASAFVALSLMEGHSTGQFGAFAELIKSTAISRFCSPALIGQDLVITAAHCVRPGRKWYIFRPGDGKYPGPVHAITKTIRHPNYGALPRTLKR
ncbi:MAG: trypsin-like serine protease [Boseongicola sp.]